MKLAEKIKAQQKQEKMTSQELARLLDITEGQLYHIYSGRRQPGIKVLSALVRLWPQLEDDVIEHLKVQRK